MEKVLAYGAHRSDGPLGPLQIDRRPVDRCDVAIDIHFCGLCHSDIHEVRNRWGATEYPIVPGHEIVGRVVRVGAGVDHCAVDDWVAVGCICRSCGDCSHCDVGEEHQCARGFVSTYNDFDAISNERTYGGYSKMIVVDRRFVFKLPINLDPARAAPLLCAGLTAYSPMKRWKVGPGSSFAVAGLGGIGHMAVKIGRALGATVTVLTSSPDKANIARSLGADHVVPTDELGAHPAEFDIVMDTIPVSHDPTPYLDILKANGTYILVGAIAPVPEFRSEALIVGNKTFAGSMIGGTAETVEFLSFCAENRISSECEVVEAAEINECFRRMEEGAGPFRYVLDNSTL